MKRLLTILFIAFSMGLFAQTGEIKPITCKALQTPNNATFYFNPPDTTLRISMGSYGILEIAGAKRYQRKLKITTTGTSGPSTLIDGTLNIPQYSGVSSGTIAATTATAIGTAAKTATISGYTLTTGNIIALTLTSGNSAAAMTLNINSTGAKNIRMNAVNTTTVFSTLAAGSVILLYYDGTYFQMLGSQRTTDTDTDTYDRTYWNNTITAGLAIYDYKIIMQGADGKWYPLTLETGTGTTKTVLTTELRIGSPILYYNSTTDVALNGTTANVYSEFPLANMTYTTNVASWTNQLPIYLKGTVLANGNFKLDNTSTTSWITQTLPTTDDGFVYILLGQMYSTTAMRLMQYHPIYQYKNGAIRLYTVEFAPISGSANYVQVSPSSAQSGNIWMNGAIGGTTAKLTNLTDGYVPYHISDANGLGNSPIYTDGTNIGINNISLEYDFQVGSGSFSGYNTVGLNASTGIPSIYFGKLGSFIGYDYAGNERMIFNSRYVNSHYEFRINDVEKMRLESGGLTLYDLASTNARLLSVSPTGQLTPIADGTNGQVLQTNGNGGYSWVNQSGGTETITVQSLSGTTPTFDTSLGLNAVLTISGNTTLAFSNVNVGSSGWINITNAATLYTLDLTGYNFKITQNIYGNTGYRVGLSGGSQLDRIGWSYDGSVVVISGSLSLKP